MKRNVEINVSAILIEENISERREANGDCEGWLIRRNEAYRNEM